MDFYFLLIMAWEVFFLFLEKECHAEVDLIGPSPANTAMLNGTTHVLECRLKPGGNVDLVAWQRLRPTGGGYVFYFGVLKSGNSRYLNFHLDTDNTTKWDLVIKDVEIEDAGNYICQEANTGEFVKAVRRVEVEVTSLKMTQDRNVVSEVVVTENVISDVMCEASGARPAVEIAWYQRKDYYEEQITSGIIQTNISTNGGDTFDTTSTLSFITTRDFAGGILRCVTTGQEVAPPRITEASLDVKYVPNVTVQYEDSILVCRADANPEVTRYIVIVNDTDVFNTSCSGNECRLPLAVEVETRVRCNATNDIGIGVGDAIISPAPQITTTIGTPTRTTLRGVNLGFKVSTMCTSDPPSNDEVSITVDGRSVAVDSDVILPSSGCVIVAWNLTRGSFRNSKESITCTNPNTAPVSGVSILPVAIPLAIVSAASIVVALVAILKSRRRSKEPSSTAKEQAIIRGHHPGTDTAEPNLSQAYMELDVRTREKESAYEEPRDTDPQPTPKRTTSLAVQGKSGYANYEDPYQEIDDNMKIGKPKEYVNLELIG